MISLVLHKIWIVEGYITWQEPKDSVLIGTLWLGYWSVIIVRWWSGHCRLVDGQFTSQSMCPKFWLCAVFMSFIHLQVFAFFLAAVCPLYHYWSSYFAIWDIWFVPAVRSWFSPASQLNDVLWQYGTSCWTHNNTENYDLFSNYLSQVFPSGYCHNVSMRNLCLCHTTMSFCAAQA